MANVHIAHEHHVISTAISMSLFLPGAGQLYNGQTIKGILLIVLFFAGLYAITFQPNHVTALLAGPGEAILWVAAILDAGLIARRLRRGQAVSAWKCF